MLEGLALLSIVTAAITSIFVARAQVERAAPPDDSASGPVLERFDDLEERLDRLEAMLSRLERSS